MTLLGAINLSKVQSKKTVKRYPSLLPEIDETILKNKKKRVDKFAHVKPKVDNLPPPYDANRLLRKFAEWSKRADRMYWDNVRLLCAIARAYKTGGKVDCHWTIKPSGNKLNYENRKNKYKQIERQNQYIYKHIINTKPRVVPTVRLQKEWQRNKRDIVQRAHNKFVLFPRSRTEIMEDLAFAAPQGLTRPRVNITLRIHNSFLLGTLQVELFTDVCPLACRLFMELLEGDGVGYSYVGTRFFRKVAHLFWRGGDVIYDNGLGCYAQKGRNRPILAENYHFSHSMPGLLSMPTTNDEELCGIFNITFKPLPQFDLKNVVFARVIRPCTAYDVISTLGSSLSKYPVVDIASARLL